MAKQYSIADARAKLSTIVDEIESGDDVELTRRGKPVAMVISTRKYEGLGTGRPSFKLAYEAFLRKFPLDHIGLEDARLEDLRDRSVGRETSF